MIRGYAPLALTAALLAGCSTRPGEPPGDRTRPVPVVPIPVAPALSSAAYLAAASSLDLLEIRSSELALARATDPQLRDFARSMIDAHHGTSAQLSFAGRRLNLLPSATLLPHHQTMLDALAASGDFDRTYLQQQQAAHSEALELHSAYARAGSSPTLRPVAQAAVPIIQRHLAQLRAMH